MNKVNQAVLLASGKSSRFYPLASSQHKSQFALLGKTFLEKTIRGLYKLGFEEIILVHSPSNKPALEVRDDLKLKLVVQQEPKGMGDALLSAKQLLADDFLVIHSYHLDAPDFVPLMLDKLEDHDSVLLLKLPQESKVGIAEYKGEQVLSVQEKPYQQQKNTYNISGTYILSQDYLKLLEQEPEKHYNFESALDKFAARNNLGAVVLKQNLLSLKYPWHIYGWRDYLFAREEFHVSDQAEIASTALIDPDVMIRKGAKIGDYAIIRGPAYIGEDCFIGDNSLIRNGTVLEEKVNVGAYTELKNCLVQQNTHVNGYLADSIIGGNCRIAHGFITANKRLDGQTVGIATANGRVNTKLKALGAIIGDNVHTGINAGTMPGMLIGSNSIIGPQTYVYKNIPEDTRYYTHES